jgi:hypothetical protein
MSIGVSLVILARFVVAVGRAFVTGMVNGYRRDNAAREPAGAARGRGLLDSQVFFRRRPGVSSSFPSENQVLLGREG